MDVLVCVPLFISFAAAVEVPFVVLCMGRCRSWLDCLLVAPLGPLGFLHGRANGIATFLRCPCGSATPTSPRLRWNKTGGRSMCSLGTDRQLRVLKRVHELLMCFVFCQYIMQSVGQQFLTT